MSTTLSNGYKLPQDGDLGDTWFDDLEFNIQRTNDHTHDGLNSEKLSGSSVVSVSTTVSSGSFALVGDSYKYQLTLPSAIKVDDKNITFRDATTREPVYLKFEFFSVTQIDIYTNSPLNLIVVLS